MTLPHHTFIRRSPLGKTPGASPHHGADTRELLKLPELSGWEIIWPIKDRRHRIGDGNERREVDVGKEAGGVSLIPKFRYSKQER